ncbi:MAG: hypothetical protein NTX59_05385 [Elusimicrobia bacterium]|nr:hypothetical protein [Elusimicrobiota bacterium]
MAEEIKVTLACRGPMALSATEIYSVLITEERLPDFALTAKILSEFHSLNLNDAGRLVRHCWGLLGSGLAPDRARELAGKCEAYGIKTIILPSAGLPKLTHPALIKKAAFANNTFSYATAGVSMNAAAADILVLSAAPLKEETVKVVKSVEGPSAGERAVRMGIMAVTGLPIGMGKSKEVKKEVRTSETSFLLDIILKQNLRLRLNPADFDFSCLKEKKTYSSHTNFNLMCAELAAFAHKALKNTGLWAILEHKPLSALPYDSMEDFEKETQRLAVLVNR